MIDRPPEIEDVKDLSEPDADLLAAGYEGFIDAIEDGRIYGWALDEADAAHKLGIDIYFGAEKIGTVVADRYREDLTVYADKSGRHAFVFNLPKALWSEDAGGFYACFEGTEVPLLRGPKCSRLQPVGAPKARQKQPQPEGEGDEDAPEADLDAILSRIEACERGLVTLLHLAHPGSDYEKRKAARSDELEADIGKVREELNSLEGFILRHDERLKKSEEIVARLEAYEGRRRAGTFRTLSTLTVLALLGVAAAYYLLDGSW